MIGAAAVELDRDIPMLIVVGLACSFDSSGAGGGATIGAHDTETGTGTSSGTPTSSTGLDATTTSEGPPGDTSGEPGTSGGPSTSSTSDASSSDGGELPDGLVERDLVSRWFLDESAAGLIPTTTADAAEEPFDLDIDFSSGHLFWTEENGQRGVRWTIPGGIGAPLRAIEGSKFEMLEGRTELTIELVASVEDVTTGDSRLFHIGTGNEMGDFTLRSDELDRLEFVVNGGEVAGWTVDLPTLGRAVFHVVFDTKDGDPDDRARLFVNGALVEPESTNPLAEDEGIALSNEPYLALGNRDGDRSISGAVFYAAVYGRPLGAMEIEHNATLLFMDDDGP